MAGEARRKKLRALLRGAGVVPRAAEVAAFEAAFVHESAARENLAEHSNERLEFLGDAIVGFVVARSLYERYPHAAEGELAVRKAALVSDAALATSAERLGFEPLLLLGAGLAKVPRGRRRSALADAFEALVAALYRTRGMQTAETFVLSHVDEHERTGVELGDPKTTLQEWTQAHLGSLPAYVDRCEGPAHERVFFADVTIDGELARGSGSSKKAAQRAAAAAALARLAQRSGGPGPRPFSQAVARAKSFTAVTSKRKRP